MHSIELVEKRHAVFRCNCFFFLCILLLFHKLVIAVLRETIFSDKMYTELFKSFCLLSKRFLALGYILSSLLQPRGNCTHFIQVQLCLGEDCSCT